MDAVAHALAALRGMRAPACVQAASVSDGSYGPLGAVTYGSCGPLQSSETMRPLSSRPRRASARQHCLRRSRTLRCSRCMHKRCGILLARTHARAWAALAVLRAQPRGAPVCVASRTLRVRAHAQALMIC